MEIEEAGVYQLLENIRTVYGYDFSQYSQASLIRRINRFVGLKQVQSRSDLETKLLNDPSFFESFVEEITVNVTEMFRDPTYYRALREKVFPKLATYPFIRIWIAGCATGEEVYSIAIMLKEEGLLEKSKIYATDINQKVLLQAKEGIYHLSKMQDYTSNYLKAGGKAGFSDYYMANYNRAIFNSSLKQNIIYSLHNLVSDHSFNEFNLIICRNVLIYFNKDLQNRVLRLFLESLAPFGYLALGKKESLMFYNDQENFEYIDREEKIYRRIRV